MNRKRSAAAALGSAGDGGAVKSSKKRKMDGVQKFYAVRAGFMPGVYSTYAECQAQTAGFKGALFKSFTSKEDAEAFAAGQKVAAAPDEPEKFYAVAVGSPAGIFTDWADASLAIKGVRGPKYKRFSTRAKAVEYIRMYGNDDALRAIGETPVADEYTETEETIKVVKAVEMLKEEPPDAPADRILRIYTDGSSLSNGKAGSRAGLGVFFGEGDPRNISERLHGEPQTNQRAELKAMQRALEVVPFEQEVQIYSDSQYSINCVTQWAPGWERKGWKTATGEKVKNQDIIRAVLALMDHRARAGGTTSYHWVKGHSTDRGNVAADKLAVRGAKSS